MDDIPGAVIEARFTPKAGLAGWFQALSRRQPLYGSGWAEPTGNGLRLYGWRRTWLGIEEQAELHLPASKIRNVAVEGASLRFDIQGLLSRSCSFELASPAAAETLAKRLPGTKTHLFERHWDNLREFNRKAAERTPRPWGTFLLIAACLSMFAVQAFSAGRFSMFDITQTISLGALSYQPVQSGEIWRLVSSAFLHLDPLHLLVNMWVLLNIGRLTERLLGSLLFLFVYLSCALLSGLGSLLWAPMMVTLGASGAIYGLFGVFLAYLLMHRTVVPAILLRAHWLSTLVFVLFTLANGFFQTNVANAGHVAGLLSGLMLGALLALPRFVQETSPPWYRVTAVVLLSAALLGAGWRVCAAQWAPAAELTLFKQSLDWLVAGEAKSLQDWAALEQRISVGKTGGADAAKAYRTEIAPFWQDAEKRAEQMEEGSSGEYKTLSRIIATYAHNRAVLAEAEAAYMENPLNTDRSDDARKALLAVNRGAAHMTSRMARDDFAHRPRGWSESSLALRLAHLLPGSNVCANRPQEARFEGDYGAETDEPAIMRGTRCWAQHQFLNADFAALEDRLSHYTETIADLPDGGSTLNGVTGGISTLFEARPTDFARYMSLLVDWRREIPDSLWPDLIEAQLLRETGWSIRGHGFASEVPPQAMQTYGQYIYAADEILRETMMHAAGNRYWYELAISVKTDLNEDRDALKETYKEGSTLFPRDQQLQAEMLRALMPRWGGSAQEVDDVISKAYARTATTDGIQVYAQLYWIYADLEGPSVDIFSESGADWQLMRKGFRDMAQKHPNSDYVLNGYARFACMAKDAEEYRLIRPKLDGHNSSTAWPVGLSPSVCDKRFAAQAG